MEIATTYQSQITAFLCQMKFKKRIIGGVDEEDVLDKIKHITEMYKDVEVALLRQNAFVQQDNSLLQNQMEQLQAVGREKEALISALQIEKASVLREQEELKAKVQEIASTLQRYEQERTELIAAAQCEAKKIIQQAMTYAEELAAQNEREIERQISARQAEIGQLTNQREVMEKEVEEIRIRMKDDLRLITENLYQMLSLIKGLDGELASGADGDALKSL
ncbi:hypothetical protein [Desulforamulus aeronauticus]|nr:hypothetical protein [Desulforamulus aeronauticus]